LVAAGYYWSIIHYQNPTFARAFKVDPMFVCRLHKTEIVSPDMRRLGELLQARVSQAIPCRPSNV
jgi:hypothetical protein